MPTARWNGVILADAPDDRVRVVEGNVYFPPDTVRMDHLHPSATHTDCPWKGTASYYDVDVGQDRNRDAAWYYPDPKDAAAAIRGHVAFWKGVEVRP